MAGRENRPLPYVFRATEGGGGRQREPPPPVCVSSDGGGGGGRQREPTPPVGRMCFERRRGAQGWCRENPSAHISSDGGGETKEITLPARVSSDEGGGWWEAERTPPLTF